MEPSTPDPPRRVTPIPLASLLVAVLGLALGLGFAVRSVSYEVIPVRGTPIPPWEEPEDRLTLRPASFTDLPGWGDDDLGAAVPALRASCRAWSRRGADEPIGDGRVAGTVSDWADVCAAVAEVSDRRRLRERLEALLTPLELGNRGEVEGLFTGYYEASLRGSRRRSERYPVPIHTRPADLVSVDLGEFRDELSGTRIAGRVVGGQLRPYEDRRRIAGGALDGRGLEILWVDDPVDAFFLQIQGSGRVDLDDGSVVRLGYSGQNGHPYTAIGRELIAWGELTREEVSMQSIRRWLSENPKRADELMNRNASYVFHREVTGPGPLGSMGLPLTPQRSLAVDRRFLPLGVPLWLTAEPPGEGGEAIERLVVAQDTGGAIRGPVRGDLFWGHGELAAEKAGFMKSRGRLWLLVPRQLAPSVLAATATEPLDSGP